MMAGDIETELFYFAWAEAERTSPYAIAKRARVSPSVVTRWLKGQRDLTLPTAAKIAHALGLKIVKIDTAAAGAEEPDFAI